MHSKWEAIKGSAGFFITMAVCLLVVGISGYFLLFNKEEPAEEVETPPAQVTATTSVPDIQEPVSTKEETPIQVVSEEPIPVETVPMPEVEIDDTPVVAEAPRLIVTPLNGDVLTAFSVDQLVYNPTLEDWRIHDGIDISATEGTSVLAASSGTVLAVKDDALMGTTIILEHAGGYQTTYANLQAGPSVEAGDSVSAGQIIGAVGTTAVIESSQSPHLHFSVTKDGDVVDPNQFLAE